MTVAEMTERMSLREYICWASYFTMENREHEKAARKIQQQVRRGRRR